MLSSVITEAVPALLDQHHIYDQAHLAMYLQDYYPEIPELLRIPVVIAATAGARQAALLHGVVEKNVMSVDETKRQFAAEAASALSFWALGMRPAYRSGPAFSDLKKRRPPTPLLPPPSEFAESVVPAVSAGGEGGNSEIAQLLESLVLPVSLMQSNAAFDDVLVMAAQAHDDVLQEPESGDSPPAVGDLEVRSETAEQGGGSAGVDQAHLVAEVTAVLDDLLAEVFRKSNARRKVRPAFASQLIRKKLVVDIPVEDKTLADRHHPRDQLLTNKVTVKEPSPTSTPVETSAGKSHTMVSIAAAVNVPEPTLEDISSDELPLIIDVPGEKEFYDEPPASDNAQPPAVAPLAAQLVTTAARGSERTSKKMERSRVKGKRSPSPCCSRLLELSIRIVTGKEAKPS
jgi:hypothetical protein